MKITFVKTTAVQHIDLAANGCRDKSIFFFLHIKNQKNVGFLCGKNYICIQTFVKKTAVQHIDLPMPIFDF